MADDLFQVGQPGAERSAKSSATAVISKLEEELSEIKAKLADAESTSADYRQDVMATAAHLTQRERQVREQHQAKEVVDARLSEVEDQKEKLEALVKSLQESSTEKEQALESQIEELLNRGKELEEEAARLKQSLDESLRQSEEEVEHLCSSYQHLEQQLLQLQDRLTQKDREQALLVSSKDSESAELRQEIEVQQECITGLRSQLQAADAASQSADEQLSALQNQVQSLTLGLREAQEACQKLQEERTAQTHVSQQSGSASPSSFGHLSEADSTLQSDEKRSGTSVEQIQQQHLFQLDSQLQDLQQRNRKVVSQLAEALAAKEEFQKRVAVLESKGRDETPREAPHLELESPNIWDSEEEIGLRLERLRLAQPADYDIRYHTIAQYNSTHSGSTDLKSFAQLK